MGYAVEDGQGSSVREIVFTDPNQWPILQVEAYQHSIWMEAPNMHRFCIDNGVYRYCDMLNAMWDQRAADQSSRPLQDENDLTRCDNNSEDLQFDQHPSFAPTFDINFSDEHMIPLLQELRDQMNLNRLF